MEHTEKYLQAKWVTENPKDYDEHDVIRADSYCKAYLDGYNQALSIANVVATEGKLCGSFEPDDKTSSATICKHCGREKWHHPHN